MADLDKLEAADIKAIIWKHWNNKNGQTLEERFTSMADEIVHALEAAARTATPERAHARFP